VSAFGVLLRYAGPGLSCSQVQRLWARAAGVDQGVSYDRECQLRQNAVATIQEAFGVRSGLLSQGQGVCVLLPHNHSAASYPRMCTPPPPLHRVSSPVQVCYPGFPARPTSSRVRWCGSVQGHVGVVPGRNTRSFPRRGETITMLSGFWGANWLQALRGVGAFLRLATGNLMSSAEHCTPDSEGLQHMRC
jgi:hypothetical protein